MTMCAIRRASSTSFSCSTISSSPRRSWRFPARTKPLPRWRAWPVQERTARWARSGAYDRAVIETVQENEQSIDMLADAVNNYLVRLSGHMEADDNSVLLNYYLQCFSEFERIGDYAVNLTESAEELHARGAQFSTTARQELAFCRTRCTRSWAMRRMPSPRGRPASPGTSSCGGGHR